MSKKILNIVFFTIMVICLLLLSISLESPETKVIKGITIAGNLHLDKDNYLDYLRINIADELPELNKIKSRLDKHPYVINSKLKIENDTLNIKIEEKEFTAILSNDNDYLISDSFELLPILPNTLNINLPVISGIKIDKKNLMKKLNGNEIKNSLYVIESSKLLDTEFYNDLIELNFRSPDVIIASFSSRNFAAVLSNSDIIKKTFCIYKIWKSSTNENLDNNIEYIDLRFDNLVYLGFKKNMIEKRES